MEDTSKDSIKKTKTYPCTGSSVSVIPNDIIFDQILSGLCPKLLIRFSCVCKFWAMTILRDPCFAAMHFRRYNQSKSCLLFKTRNFDRDAKNRLFCLEKDGLELQEIATSNFSRQTVGSCNGLACFFNMEAQILEVCNPTRRQILGIFLPPVFDIRCYGFGFDPLNNQYKIVCLFDTIRCMVFTLGTSLSWKEVDFPPQISSSYSKLQPIDRMPVICCNGYLYWKSENPSFFLSFDLHKEKFQVIQLATDQPYKCNKLLVYNGYLCDAGIEQLISPGEPPSCKFHMHILKGHIGQVWTKETIILDILPPLGTEIVTFFDQVLLVWRPMGKGYLIFYNVHTKEVQKSRHTQSLEYSMVYSFSNYSENLLTLQTFLHEETPILGDYPSVKAIRKLKEFRNPEASQIAFMFSSCQNQETRTEFCS